MPVLAHYSTTSCVLLAACSLLLLLLAAQEPWLLSGRAARPALAPVSSSELSLRRLLARFAGVPGAHPLCNPDTLRAEVERAGRAGASLPLPPSRSASSARAPAAVVSVLGSPPSETPSLLVRAVSGRSGYLVDLEKNFGALDEHLLAPFLLDFVLLYQRGASEDCGLLGVLQHLGWLDAPPPHGKRVGTSALLCPLSFRKDLVEGDYWTPRGTHVRVRARDFALPRYLTLEQLAAPGWASCAGSRWHLGYLLYSGAVFAHHVYLDEVLAGYEYTFKVDTDVAFHRRPPVSPVEAMRAQGCSLAHSQIKPGSEYPDCQAGAFAALQRFSRQSGSATASAAHEWCSSPVGIDYFYGNFMGVASALMRSEANALLNIWLYECHDGYFRHRWSDQATPALYLCQWLDIPSLNATPHVCDFSAWRRDGVFEHT